LTSRVLQHSCCTIVDIEDAYDELILHKSIFGHGLHVYNCSTGQMSSLASEPLMSSKRYYSLVYDLSIQKYKVVCFCLIKNMIKCYICFLDSNDEVNENVVWRKLSLSFQVIFPTYPITYFDRVVCNGALNWIVESIEESEEDMVAFVLSIDISSEKLRERTELPCKPNICYMEMFNCKLLAFDGVLCYAKPTSFDEFDFWVLRDWIKPIWIKQHTLRLSSMICKLEHLRSFIYDDFLPLAIYQCNKSCSAKILILHCHKLFIYNVTSQELRSNVVKEEEGFMDACSLPRFSKFTFINRPVCWN
jgi:F-box interacting protein